jgi:hypothetical protein
MKPSKPSRQTADLFRERLDAIIDREHALVRLGRLVPWADFDSGFGTFYNRSISLIRCFAVTHNDTK